MVFASLVVASIAAAAAGGNLAALSDAVLDGAARAVTLTLSLAGMMCLWCGVMQVFSAAGVLRGLSRLLRPLLVRVFPETYRSGEGVEELCANLAANLLGVGNAATPFALAALGKMQARNPTPAVASDDMVTLSVLNTSSLSLIPSTLIALRRYAGSAHATAILLPVWLVSAAGAVCAVVSARMLRHLFPVHRRDAEARSGPGAVSMPPPPDAPLPG